MKHDKKVIALFGGTGGLGSQLVPFLEKNYIVIPIGSKDVDITSLQETKKFFDTNDIDIVINMSGKKYDVFLNQITECDESAIQDMLNVNVIGNINILAASLPKMIEKNYGRVISLSSVFSTLNVPKNSIYSASKAFIDRLVSTANKENVKYGITCNTIQLGYWDGGMCYRVDESLREKAKNKIGLKRWGTIEELYNTINFIIQNQYVSGINLKIDGGL